MRGLLKGTRPVRSKKEPLVEFYQFLLQSEASPFQTAVRNLEFLEREDEDEEKLLMRCLEGAAYSSLQATCYEEMLISLADHPDIVEQLIQQFQDSREMQHDLIWEQAYTHGNYVMRGGQCPGCEQCENHKDVDELIPHYQERDLLFFLELYLGMQAVHLGMDELVFRFIREDPSRVQFLSRDRILNYRSYIYGDAKEKFGKMAS